MALEHKQQQNPRWVPTEIIVEILLRLPVKSLLRFKSVCKLWYSLISYQRFVKSHLTLSLCNPHYLLISIDNYLSCRLYDLETFGESFNVLELKNPFTAKDTRARILGSCNGLLCIIVDESSIIIWNPSTRRVNVLPHCDFRGRSRILDVRFGFGYDESNDDYKVVAISSKRVKIYSLKSGCWKTLGDFPRGFIDQAIGIFLNGTLHWMTIRDSSSKNYLSTIVSFDLATETFGEILQPVYDKGHNYLTLCRLGEWLSVVCYYGGNRSDVWVMKVYGVQDSWTKLVSIPHLTTTMIPGSLMPLCITHDGKYLLKLGNELVMYDPKSSSLSEIQKIDIYSSAHTFIESLVSPMPKGVPAGSRDTHGFFNSIILRFKKICAPGHIWSCVRPCRWMPNVN